MRITKIELEGVAGRAAVMELPEGDEFIRVRFTVDGQTFTRAVQANDAGDRQSMAEILQEALDGRRGTQGDIFPYSNAIDLLAGQ